MTISPYEWSWPYHQWLSDELEKACAERQYAPAAETLHIAHILSQAVAGLLTGSNDGLDAKDEHVFAAAEPGQRGAGNPGSLAWSSRTESVPGTRGGACVAGRDVWPWLGEQDQGGAARG